MLSLSERMAENFYTIGNITVIAATAVGLVGGIASYWGGQVRDQYADARLEKIRANVVGRLESISDAQMREFVATIARVSKTPIEFIVLNEPESVQFGDAIVGLFKHAQWEVAKTEKMPFWFPRQDGLHFEIKALPEPSNVRELREALKGLGIPTFETLASTTPEPHDVRLVIGPKARE
jgi:hypothetical protein